jgi:hypothetical protein
MVEIVFMTALIAGVGTLVSLYTYFGLMYLKAWLFDADSPDLSKLTISRIMARICSDDPWFDVFLFSVYVAVAIILLALLILTPIWKFTILAIFVVAGLHATRWAIRIGNVLDKIKSMVRL